MNDLTSNPLCRPFDYAGSRDHGILILHGFTGSIAHMVPFGRYLAGEGFTVKGISLRGHNGKEREMAHVSKENWIRDALFGFDQLAEQCRKVSVVGLSMGGALALHLTANRPVYRAVPVAAALHIYNRWAPLARVVAPFYPYWQPRTSGSAEPEDPFSVGYDGLFLHSVAEFNSLIRQVRRELPNISCPLLVVRAGQDKTVRPDSADWIMQRTASSKKELLELPESGHVCVLGSESRRLFQKTAEFLRK